MKRITMILLSAVMIFALVSCGQPADGGDMEGNSQTAETVNLSELPEDCELIPFEKFKEGFAFISNTNWEEPPATYSEVAEAFDEEGVYYENCDVVEDGITYKTYAWFSDEEWLDSTVSVAVTFKADDSGELIYYSYTAQGIDYTDVQ